MTDSVTSTETAEDLLHALRAEEWGKIQAWIVEGAPDRATGIEYAKRITSLNVRIDNTLAALRAAPQEAPREVDGYAVVMADGPFVGIWRDREIAESLCAKQPAGHKDRVEPMVFASWKSYVACRSMDSAPKDGTTFLAYVPSLYQGKGDWAVMLWHAPDWKAAGTGWNYRPSCWCPLPSKPSSQPGRNQGEKHG